jgi:hypothetical protein
MKVNRRTYIAFAAVADGGAMRVASAVAQTPGAIPLTVIHFTSRPGGAHTSLCERWRRPWGVASG